jgi:uncharacterized protein (DUF488 family)
MLRRQQIILYLLKSHASPMETIRLVKLAFLLRQETSIPSEIPFYDFVPFKKGPYSFTLNHELGNLEKHGYLSKSHDMVQLLSEDLELKSSLPEPLAKRFEAMLRQYHAMTTDAIISTIYRRYPWYTVNSMNRDHRGESLPVASPAIYTVGYERLSVDELLDMLLRKGIRMLVDVRKNPVARRFGFHKSTLSRLTKELGIDYLHIPELGIPSAWRSDLSDQAAYDRLFLRYTAEILPQVPHDVNRLSGIMRQTPAALLCMEENPSYCHRTSLGRLLAARTGLRLLDLRH